MQPFGLTEELQDELDAMRNRRFIGSAGGGLVTVTLSLDFKCVNIKIDSELTDNLLIEELVSNAFNDAVEAVHVAHTELGATLMNTMFQHKGQRKTHESCDCTKCNKTDHCPVRPLKELMKTLETE